MALSQSVSFLYNSQLPGIGAERANLNTPLIIRDIISWKLTDKLNTIDEFKVKITKLNNNLKEIYQERDIFISALNLQGIIIGINDIDDNVLELIIQETAWHFTRRIYKIEDTLKEYNITLAKPASFPDLIQGIIDSANLDMPVLSELNIPGLISYWKFDGNTDDSKGTHNGTWVSSSHYVNGFHHNNQAMDTENTDYITVADHADLDLDYDKPFSLVVRFKTTDLGATVIVGKTLAAQQGPGWSLSLKSADQKLRFSLEESSSVGYDFNTKTVVTDGEWQHAVITYDGLEAADFSGWNIFLNGIDDFNSGSNSNPSGSAQNGELMSFGADADGTDKTDIIIDEVRLYNRKLTELEAVTLFRATQPDIDNIRRMLKWKLGDGESFLIPDLGSIYQFDENLVDNKGVHDLTEIGTPVYVDQLYDKMIKFPTSADSASLADHADYDKTLTQPFSFSFWYIPPSEDTYVILAKKIGSGGVDAGYSIIWEGAGGSNRILARYADGTTDHDVRSAAGGMKVGQLYHIVVTKGATANKDAIRIYVDKVVTQGANVAMSGSFANSQIFVLNRFSAGSFAGTNQIIGDLRKYDKELTPEEISLLFEAKFSYIDNIRTDGVPATSDLDFDIKWKNYYELFQIIAKETLNDIWFEEDRVIIATKGKTVVPDSNDRIYKKLKSKISLKNYANIVTVVGAKVTGVNVHSTQVDTVNDFTYQYEKVVSNNNLKTQASVDTVAPRILTEFNSVNPDVTIDISNEIIKKYDLKSGDIIKIIASTSTQKVKGFYRIVSLVHGDDRSIVKLQFSSDGKFIPRISDSLEILNAALIKIKEIELNS